MSVAPVASLLAALAYAGPAHAAVTDTLVSVGTPSGITPQNHQNEQAAEAVAPHARRRNSGIVCDRVTAVRRRARVSLSEAMPSPFLLEEIASTLTRRSHSRRARMLASSSA
jgi:hypothetical protein